MAKLIPYRREFFATLPFWAGLSGTEKQAVESHTKELLEAMRGHTLTRLEIGQHLLELHKVLEHRRCFRKFVVKNLGFGWRTAYRYMSNTKTVKANISDYALSLAADRGMDLVGFQPSRPFGPYTEAIHLLPPPTIEGKVPEWLDKIEAARQAPDAKKGHCSAIGQADRMRAVYRSVAGHFRAVQDGAGRGPARRWGLKLLAVLLREFELEAQKIVPMDPPEGFRAVLGRPKKTRTP